MGKKISDLVVATPLRRYRERSCTAALRFILTLTQIPRRKPGDALFRKCAAAFYDVRFGSKADICGATAHVRFTPNSDRESGH